MDEIEKKQYEHLRNRHNAIIWYVLGPDYYTISMDVYGCDTESTNAIIEEYKRVKKSRDNWKKVAIILYIVIGIFCVSIIANL